ncbi:MAG TPA: Kdo hydroxylase family protein [Bryobacteraceae bacterium]|nr:Kdo hydroxylase family protein [Bryobacteraceae bacterium]
MTVTAPMPAEPNYLALEQGNILYFPHTPFPFSDQERDVLRSSELSSSRHHKNIAYRPATDKVTGFDSGAVKDPERLRTVLRAYSQRALEFLRSFVPRYMDQCRLDFASFRPLEEEGRDLPTKKRNDLLHVDSFPTRPTGGDLILRFFTNINTTKPRVWITSDPMAALAPRYADDAGLSKIARGAGSLLSRMLFGAGLGIKRSPYDRFMLGFHDYLKFKDDYQRDCPKYRFEFPPDSSWMVFTDVVPHAVLSGQYALEQTVIVKRESLVKREHAPIAILEAICHQRLG